MANINHKIFKFLTDNCLNFHFSCKLRKNFFSTMITQKKEGMERRVLCIGSVRRAEKALNNWYRTGVISEEISPKCNYFIERKQKKEKEKKEIE